MLYTLSQTMSNKVLAEWLPLFMSTDKLLLTENGVINAIKNSQYCDLLLRIPVGSIYALERDVIARGLMQYITPEVKIITDKQWVDLTVAHYPQVAL